MGSSPPSRGSTPKRARVRVVVGPLATASGRLVDPDGKILAAKKLPYGIRVYVDDQPVRSFSDVFGGTMRRATPRADSSSAWPGPRSRPYQVGFELTKTSWLNARQVTPKGPGPLDLGDIQVDPDPDRPKVRCQRPGSERGRGLRLTTGRPRPADRKAELLAEAQAAQYTRTAVAPGSQTGRSGLHRPVPRVPCTRSRPNPLRRTRPRRRRTADIARHLAVGVPSWPLSTSIVPMDASQKFLAELWRRDRGSSRPATPGCPQ